MDALSFLLVVAFLLLFGIIIFVTIRQSQKELKEKQAFAQSLGFAPHPVDEKLTLKISRLYQRPGAKTQFQLRNVFHKPLLDGDMFLFDLVNTSGEDDSWTERQAVAICSSTLNLPAFMLYPKADPKYALSGLANKVLEWGFSFVGKPVAFPEYPALNARYLLSSNEPDLLRPFFDARLAEYFAQTQMYMLHAQGEIFTFSEMDPQFNTLDQGSMHRRIQRALELFRQLQKSTFS